jgi:parvulin-like peptidyl-prolyl isomerase
MNRLCAILVGCAVLALAREVRGSPELVNGLQAVVHDAVVTYAEVLTLSMPAEQMLAREYRGQYEAFQKKAIEARNDSLDQLIERQLILHDFKVTFKEPERMAMVEKEINKDVDREVDQLIRTRYGGNRMSLVRTLQSEGITIERQRQQIRDRIILTWLRQKNIDSEVIISPHRVEAYYLTNRSKFVVPEQVKVRMIVLKCPGEAEAPQTERLAEDILRELNAGATFAEMATIHSEGSQRSQGGDLGWWDVSGMVRSLADTAVTLQAGQHSGVLSRSGGEDYWVCQYEKGVPTVARHYVADDSKKEKVVEERRAGTGLSLTNLPAPVEFYLMLVEDKRPSSYKPLVDVRDQIEKDLQAEEKTRLEKQWVLKLKKKTFIRIF